VKKTPLVKSHAEHDYAFKPLRDFVEFLISSLKITHFSTRGMTMLLNSPKMNQRLIDLTEQTGRVVSEGLRSDLEESLRDAAFIEQERKKGFSTLNAYGVVGCWGAFEAAVEDTVVAILCHEPLLLKKEPFSKIKLPLSKFENLDRDERMRLIVTEVTRTQLATGHGASAFEPLLGLFDLSGDIARDTKKILWEMNHVRNVIVHRNSHADARLVEECPWLGLKSGDIIYVDAEKFIAYTDALIEYVRILNERLTVRYPSGTPTIEESDTA
jgi:hypothetical protein